MKPPYQYVRLTIAICSIALTSTFTSAVAADNPSSQPLFENHNLLRVQIEAPFTTLMRDRSSDEYQDGLIHVITESGTRVTLDLKIRTRGNYRRKAENCDFAPLRLNFSKEQVTGTVFEGQDKLKLVTHCDNTGRVHEQSVLREQLAYRILNQLTDLSFRVRLLQIDYIDTDRSNKTLTKYGILIEDDAALYRRIGLQFAEIPSAIPEQLDPQHTALITVFQYLIGNTDFSPLRGAAGEFCCHNTVLVSGAGTGLIPIPYDFDLSGLVDAPYATPNPKLKIEKVTQRLYQGYCIHNELLDRSIGLLSEKRETIALLVEAQEGLSKASRRSAAQYIDKFYDRISSDSGIERNLIRECL
jgi:hypothetical protein